MLKRVFDIVSSKALLIWLIAGWTLYYVTSAVWSKEAFANFIGGLADNPALQVPYIIFLLSLALNILRVGREKLRAGVFGFALWLLLPLGAFLFFSGYFVSSFARNYEWLLVTEGNDIGPKWQTEKLLAKKLRIPFKEEFMTVEESESPVFSFEPKVILTDMTKDYTVGVYPPRRIKGTYYHILNFGFAPGVRLISPDGNIVEEGYLALKILPPGREDKFEIQHYRFAVRLAPDRIVRRGDTEAKIFSLKAPSYRVKVYKADEMIFEGDSREGISFDGFRLEFIDLSYWAYMEAVKDPGVPLIVGGLVFLCLGVVILPFRVIIIKAFRKE